MSKGRGEYIMKHKYLGIFLTCLIFLSSISLTYADTTPNNNVIYVLIDGNDNNTGLTPETSKRTIQNAINTVKNGGKIHIMAGTYKETLTVNKNVHLIGKGSDKTILNADYNGTGIDIKPWKKVLIEGITITQGYSWESGGGIYNDRSSVTLRNCIIRNNKVFFGSPFTSTGGGIYNYYGDMLIENSTIQSNEIYQNGAGIASVYSNLVIKDSIIQNNLAPSDWPPHTDGGGVYVWYGSVTLENNIIRNNYASFGGGISLKNTHATLRNCVIQNNTAQLWGGGLYNYENCGVDMDDATRKQCVNNNAPRHPNGYWD